MLQMLTSKKTLNSGNDRSDDKWLVKSNRVSIQARYMPDDTLADPNVFVRAVAVGGPFLQDNIIVIGSLEGQITFNHAPILEGLNSSFNISEGEHFFVKARRSEQSQLVEDVSKQNQGVNIELPHGVSLVVNRLHNHVNVAITMCQQEGGQEGQCGNFNGLSVDDTMEFASDRFDMSVLPEDSLFERLA